MYQYLSLEKQEGTGIIRFLRPDQLNAMNRAFMDEIAASLKDCFDDPHVNVIILTGSGRAFMAGADIKEYAAQTDDEFVSFQNKGKEIYEAIENSKKPVIAAVNGFALGGGFAEVNIGLNPGGGGTQRLIQKVNMNRAKEILYFGGQYTADQMLGWGVVNYVVEDSELMDRAKELSAKFQRRSLEAVGEMKRLLHVSVSPLGMDKRRDMEIQTLFDLFHTEQAKERIAAFANKNKK